MGTRAADCPQLESMGWKRGHPVGVGCILGTLRNTRSRPLVSSFHPGLQFTLCTSPSPTRPVPRSCLAASLRSIHLCNPTHLLSFSFCWQAPAGTCALILFAINSTDPFPVGLWAQFASHRPQTFGVWGYHLLKNWSPSFLRPLR